MIFPADEIVNLDILTRDDLVTIYNRALRLQTYERTLGFETIHETCNKFYKQIDNIFTALSVRRKFENLQKEMLKSHDVGENLATWYWASKVNEILSDTK